MNAMERILAMGMLCVSVAQLSSGEPMYRVKGFDPRSVTFDVPRLVERARQGDGEAYYQLGVMVLCGHESKANHFIAHDYLRKAHELGYGYASLLLGMSHEFGGSFVNRAVAFCEDLPYRALIAEYHPNSPWGLDDRQHTAREYYAQALTNGIAHARFCLDRMDRADVEMKRKAEQRNQDYKRALTGDCRTPEERRFYEQHMAWQRERDERETRRKREEEERRQAKAKKLESQIAQLRKENDARLVAAESGTSAAEYYWAACFLRAWAATASNDNSDRRVDLARRALAMLEKSAEAGFAQAEYDLGRMLVGGDTGTIGPNPQNRGGFLDTPPGVSWDRVPEYVEIVKKSDVKGPCFAPNVLVTRISADGTVTNVTPVLVYRQDIKRGVALLHRAAERKHAGAQGWFADRKKAGLPEDAPPWALARDAFGKTTTHPVLKIRSYERSTDYLGWVYREISLDRVTGEVVGRSAEVSERTAESPWKNGN